MKKILFINCSATGSTGKIIRDIVLYMDQEQYTSILCVPNTGNLTYPIKAYATSFGKEQAICRRVSYLLADEYGVAPFATFRLLNIIKCEKPDVVHIHCANGNMVNIYQLFSHLKKNRIPTVVTNHAEFYYTGNCSHAIECMKWKSGCGNCPRYFGMFDRTKNNWNRMKQAFSGFDRLVVTSVSPWCYRRSMQSPIMENIQQCIIENGVDTEIFRPYMKDETHKLALNVNSERYKKIIFHVTARFSPNDKFKGGFYVTELARRFNDILFLVAANTMTDCDDLPDNIVMLGSVTNQIELASYYSLADLSLVTSLRETFGMPVAESLCCGTPIVGFKAGGPESVAVSQYSEFCDHGNVDSLEKIIRDKWINYKAMNGPLDIGISAKEKYSSFIMAQKYINLYDEILNDV